ncbi:fatty acyl-CoA reductase wat-like [Schistocerca cancellata]|uniref:fatty acyl-CoA reductase wat-like n=1 Tax=Schistocerca cancellata TaxID=274614 RepID=UPI0021196D93|nr:fatty acyl-CoA reductase wat-like [Schistocerca cancellata]
MKNSIRPTQNQMCNTTEKVSSVVNKLRKDCEGLPLAVEELTLIVESFRNVPKENEQKESGADVHGARGLDSEEVTTDSSQVSPTLWHRFSAVWHLGLQQGPRGVPGLPAQGGGLAGDCTQPGLGISPADAAELTSRVSVVFHVAATVRFDADLRTATVTNVGCTCEVVALAKRMPNLKAFVYMSTAYSHAPRDVIDEKFYAPALKAEELLKLISVMNDEQLAQILPLLMGDWPNTYTFTKSIAEDVIRSEAVGLPASIIRPSVVLSTYQEPLALWVGNMYGPTAAGAGSSVGLLHAMHMDRSALVDGVPADMVANATLACAWDTWCRHSSQTPTQRATAEPVIYNYVSTPRHPISYDLLCRYAQKGTDYPSIRNLWVAYVVLLKEKYLYVIAAVVLHLIPAIIVDSFLYLKGMKPILWNMYSKIHMVSQALEPFWTKEWTFKDDNVASLLVRLGEADRKLFHFDIADYDWEWHLANTMRGFRLYIMNESYDNLEAARKRYHRLLVLHYTLLAIGSAVLLLVLWRILAAHIGL